MEQLEKHGRRAIARRAGGHREPTSLATRGMRVAWRGGCFALLWWALAGRDPLSWVVGVPSATAATALSLYLTPERPWPWRLGGLLRFAPFFLWHSLRGGVDVAARALHPGLPLDPDLIRRPWSLPEGPPRVLFANSVTLFPGTLSAGFDDRGITVHVLDRRRSTAGELDALEARVADVFGLR